jgi:predicted DCC family thiol-disulfide oxidoreductase YuxK
MCHPILLYDGVCGLCNHFVQFILRRDRDDQFRFASLQSALASRILLRHDVNPGALDTLYVVVNPESAGSFGSGSEHLLARSDAAIFILRRLPGSSQVLAFILRLMPRSLRDFGYNIVARTRYRIFGRYETCPLPSSETRRKFLAL